MEVFADVACPFTHVGLTRFRSFRNDHDRRVPLLRLRAWPLEWVNGRALDGPSLTPKVEALRASVAPDLFTGFEPNSFPTTTLPALASEAAAYRVGPELGEHFSLAVREALFEQGRDVADAATLATLRKHWGVPEPTDADHAAVQDDFADGRRRGVSGSPHFFTENDDFFCPSLDIQHDEVGYQVSFDTTGFLRFIDAVFA